MVIQQLELTDTFVTLRAPREFLQQLYNMPNISVSSNESNDYDVDTIDISLIRKEPSHLQRKKAFDQERDFYNKTLVWWRSK